MPTMLIISQPTNTVRAQVQSSSMWLYQRSDDSLSGMEHQKQSQSLKYLFVHAHLSVDWGCVRSQCSRRGALSGNDVISAVEKWWRMLQIAKRTLDCRANKATLTQVLREEKEALRGLDQVRL